MTNHLETLPVLVLEPHNRCNCRCVMCDIWKITDAQELSAEDLQRQLDSIVRLKVEWVVFTGGEPLMHSGLFRLASMLRAYEIRVSLLSTGLLLERHAQQIVVTIDDLIVSLDGPREIHDQIRNTKDAFERMAAGIAAIRRYDPNLPIAARCTVQAANAGSLVATVAAARTLGLRSISFLAADVSSQAFNRTNLWPESRAAQIIPDLAVLDEQLESLISTYSHDGFILESPAKLRMLAAHFRACQGFEAHVAPRCNAPWVSAVVEANGDVRPCFFHPPLGNLNGLTIEQVLNSPRALAFRQSLDVERNPVCQKCVCSLYIQQSQ